MSANRWYKDSTLARDCQGCTSKIHALAIACRKIPHTIGNKAAAREIPARPVTPHPSRKASGFPQAQRRKRPPFARHPPKPEGRQFFTGATRKKAPSRPVTPPKPEGLRFPQAQRERRPRPGHPTQTGRAAIFRRRNAKEGPRSRGARPNQRGGGFPQARCEKRPPLARRPPKPEGRQFSAGTSQKKTPLCSHSKKKAPGKARFPKAQRGGRPRPGHPTQIGRTAVFRRHVAGEGLHPAPKPEGRWFPQARREKRPPFARRPPKPEGRQFSAGATWKKTLLCSHSKKKAPGKARFPQGRFERKPRLPWDPPPNQKGGNFPQAQRGRRLPPALPPPPKPEGRRLCRVGGLSPPAPAGSGPRRPGCWRGSRRWRPP